jgi:hypothetical protein
MSQARIHFVLLVVWCLLVIPTLLLWRDSIAWITFMSIYAIIASHWAAWEASKAKQAVEQ